MKKDDKKADNKIDREEYEAAFIPNWELLAKLVEIAKGPERTMAQFAKDCGKSPATFSRIMHGRNEKRLSEKVLKDIADNAYESDIVNFEALMRANGMVPKHDKGQTQNVRLYFGEKYDQMTLRRNQIKRLIADQLDARGVMSCFSSSLHLFPDVPKSQYGISYRSSFSAKLQTEDKIEDQTQYWNFTIIFHDMPKETVDKIQDLNIGRYLRPVFTFASALFLRDEWEPETLKGIKNSLIFVDPIYYEFVVNNLPDIKVNSDMSLILVDIDNNKVVKEVKLPRKDGKTHFSIFEKEPEDDTTLNSSGSDDGDFGLFSDDDNI